MKKDFNEHIAKITWRIMWEEHRKTTIIILFLSIAGLPFTFMFSSVIFFAYFFFVSKKAYKKIIKDFALANDFRYEEKGSLNSVKGIFFNFGYAEKLNNIIYGIYNNKKIRFLNYETKYGFGRYQRAYYFSVFEIFFTHYNFPSIVLHVRRNDSFEIQRKVIEIKLEDRFKKDFRLLCSKGYEIEALQVFTPKVLSFFQTNKQAFTLEMTEDRLYVYKSGWIYKPKQLYDLFVMVQYIIDSLSYPLERLNKDSKALHQYYNNKAR